VRSRDPRNTWRSGALLASVGCAYKAGRSGRVCTTRRSRCHQGPFRKRGGCAMKVAGLTRGDLRGCPRCPVLLVRGVVRDGGVERPWLAVEKSAEVVLPAGSLIAGKDRTRSRAQDARARGMDVERSQPREGSGGTVRR